MSFKKGFKYVRTWCEATGISVGMAPRNLSKERAQLRYDLLSEENKEYLQGVNNDDTVEIADALGDMLYVLLGTMLEHGMQDYIESVFGEIHRSNMSKLDHDGERYIVFRREDGKVLKGPNYVRPNINKIING